MTKLIDFSFSRFSGASIKAAGFSGALRYLSSTPSKCLTAEEATDFIANGLSFGLVWEDTANAALLGFNQGVSDAKKALSQANTLGYPGCVIYFAVDFDSTPEQQTQIDDYLRGVASIIGLSRTGVYGSFYICQRCQTSGTATWFWQTLAWSGGQIASNIHIYQNGQSAMGGGADVDEARQENWGQISPNTELPIVNPAPPIELTTEPAPIQPVEAPVIVEATVIPPAPVEPVTEPTTTPESNPDELATQYLANDEQLQQVSIHSTDQMQQSTLLSYFWNFILNLFRK
jgi:hypothetical protein